MVEVAAAIVLNNHINAKNQDQGVDATKILVSLRKKDAHQGGLWEFPGGKIESGEAPEQALSRELKEELDIVIIKNEHLITVKHSYSDKTVNIHFYMVHEHSGEPRSMEGQTFQWVSIENLSELDFPKANLEALSALNKIYS